jgi:hypothetical protein
VDIIIPYFGPEQDSNRHPDVGGTVLHGRAWNARVRRVVADANSTRWTDRFTHPTAGVSRRGVHNVQDQPNQA